MRAIFGLIKTLLIFALIAGVIYLGVNFGIPKLKSLVGQTQPTEEVSQAPAEATPAAPGETAAQPSIQISKIANAIGRVFSGIRLGGSEDWLAPITQKETVRIMSERPLPRYVHAVWIVLLYFIWKKFLSKRISLGTMGRHITSFPTKTNLILLLVVLLVVSLGLSIGINLPTDITKGIVCLIGLIISVRDFKPRINDQWNNLTAAIKRPFTGSVLDLPANTAFALFQILVMPLLFVFLIAAVDIFIASATGLQISTKISSIYGGQFFVQLSLPGAHPALSGFLSSLLSVFTLILTASSTITQEIARISGTMQILAVWGLALFLVITRRS